MIDTTNSTERLEELAAWHRLNADHAGCAWIWEARLRKAEDLERQAADLRVGQTCKSTRSEPRRFSPKYNGRGSLAGSSFAS